MFLSYRAPLQLTKLQAATFEQYAGTARKIWNWGLSKTREALYNKEKIPTAFDLQKRITQMKKTEEWAWLKCVSKSVPEVALVNLDNAWQDAFSKAKKRPRFKSRVSQDKGFGFNSPSVVSKQHIRLPKIGVVKLARSGYIPVGRYSMASVVCRNGTWYVSVRKEVEELPNNGKPFVGIDVGVVNLITTSCGVSVKNPRTLKRNMRKLKTLQQSLSRKKKGSKNRSKAKIRLARKHEKVANIRKTNLHRISKVLTTEHSFIGIEDLRVSQMTRKGKKQRKKTLNQSVLDASFSELRRQLEYKGKRYGCKVVAVNPAYTSQCCSQCGFISRENRKSQSAFECLGCGFAENADLNAAINILAKAVATDHEETINACGSRKKTASVRKRRLGKKQEKNLLNQ